MVLDTSSTSDTPTWVDATVVSSHGKQHGSRHSVKMELSGKEMEVDLNRFNHAVQVFETVGKFFALRAEFFNHLRESERTVCTCTVLTLSPQSVNNNFPRVDCTHTSVVEDRNDPFPHPHYPHYPCVIFCIVNMHQFSLLVAFLESKIIARC